MKKNLKAVALLIVGLALTGSVYTLATGSSVANDVVTEKASADSTASKAKKKMPVKKEEGKAEQDKTSAKAEESAVADTITTESGLKYVITRKGKGDAVKSGQNVAVHYAGRLASNGKEFDNSFKRQSPIEFKLGTGRVIKGWDEGIAGMQVGEQRTLIIPSELGYGKRGAGSGLIPADATLIFDVELVAIK